MQKNKNGFLPLKVVQLDYLSWLCTENNGKQNDVYEYAKWEEGSNILTVRYLKPPQKKMFGIFAVRTDSNRQE